MNILFTINRGYIDHVLDCIRSIVRFPCDTGYEIFILHSDLQEEDERSMEEVVERPGVSLHFQAVDQSWFSMFPESQRYPGLIYYRIFAAYFLPKDLDRILYLDADTIVINPLNELYQMEFEGNYYIACTHVRKLLNKVNQLRLGIEEDYTYINSGVMLMDLEQLRKHQDVKEVLDYVEKRGFFFALPDQDILTALYGSKTKIVDTMKYNLSDRMLVVHNSDPNKKKLDLKWVREHAVIIHYYGKQKPWKTPYRGCLDVFYQELKSEM